MKTTAFCFVVIYVTQSPLSTFHLYVVSPAPSMYVIACKFLLYFTVILSGMGLELFAEFVTFISIDHVC